MGITIQPAAYAYHRRNGDFPAAWAAMTPWALKQSINRQTGVQVPTRFTMSGNVYVGYMNSLRTPTAWEINSGNAFPAFQGNYDIPNNGYCHEYPYIICVTYDTFANIPASSVSTWRELGINYDTTSTSIFGLTNRVIIPDAMANYIYVTGIYVFDNSNDGNYSTDNPRTILNDCDIFTPADVSEVKLYRNGDIFGSSNTGQILITLKNTIAPYYSGSQGFHYNPVMFNVMQAATADMKIPMSKMVQVVGLNGSGVTVCRATLYPTVADLKRDLYGWGVPFTLSYDAALYDNTSDFTDDPGDGTPPNPFGGGGGNGDNFDDPIPFPDTPFSPASLGGYLTLVQSPAELKGLTNVIWKPVIKDLSDALKVYFNTDNLTNSVLSIMFFPVDLAAMPLGLTHSDSIRISWSEDNISADIMGNGVSHEIDAGYYDVAEYYGSFLDYSPYTSIDIWLPYIGYKPLDIDAIMGKKLNVKYYIDFIDGIATAVIFANGSPINTFSGQLGIDLAVTGRDKAAKLRQTIDAVATMTTGVNKSATGIAQAIGSAYAGDVGGAVGPMSGVTSTMSGATMAGLQTVFQQPTSTMYGTAGGENWLSMPQKCHIKITRTVAASPAAYISEMGYPASYTGKVSAFTDYLKCSAVFGEFLNIPADDADEIQALLQSGIHIKKGAFD